MTKEKRKTTIGGAEILHSSSFSDAELNLAFEYLCRLQSLRCDMEKAGACMESYTIKPSEKGNEWEFVSLKAELPVSITPLFDITQTVNMAKTAINVTNTLKNLRMMDDVI